MVTGPAVRLMRSVTETLMKSPGLPLSVAVNAPFVAVMLCADAPTVTATVRGA